MLRRRFIFEARCHDVLTLKNSACPLRVWNGIFAAGDWRAKRGLKTMSPRRDRKSETTTREKWPQKRTLPQCIEHGTNGHSSQLVLLVRNRRHWADSEVRSAVASVRFCPKIVRCNNHDATQLRAKTQRTQREQIGSTYYTMRTSTHFAEASKCWRLLSYKDVLSA